jgi:hypothetical protein
MIPLNNLLEQNYTRIELKAVKGFLKTVKEMLKFTLKHLY